MIVRVGNDVDAESCRAFEMEKHVITRLIAIAIAGVTLTGYAPRWLARLSHCKSLSRLIVALGARRRQRAQSGVAAGAGCAGSSMCPSVG